MTARYSYSLQYAESDFDEVDEKGVAAPAAILAAFDEFNWRAQARAANALQKCAPTSRFATLMAAVSSGSRHIATRSSGS